MAFNWSKRLSTSRHQRKNIFSNNSGRKDTIKILKLFLKYTYLESIKSLEPFAFSNGFFFKLHKNSAALPLSQVERGWHFQKMLLLSCACSRRPEILYWNQGQKREVQGLFWYFFLGVLRGPHSVTSRHFAPSRVEWAGGERLGTRLWYLYSPVFSYNLRALSRSGTVFPLKHVL